MSPPRRIVAAGHEQRATHYELDASLDLFAAAVMRGDNTAIVNATEFAHAALQRHLDAQASLVAVAKEMYGR